MKEETLRRYADDADPFIRRRAAKSKDCPRDLLERFLTDHYMVRVVTYLNPALPEDLIWRALKDTGTHTWMHTLFLRRTDLTYDMLLFIGGKHIFRHPCYPVSRMRAVVASGTPEEKRSLAKHPRLPQSIQDLLLNDTADVRKSLATNKFISDITYQKLLDDSSIQVIRNLTKNPLSENHRDELTRALSTKQTSMASAYTIARYAESPEVLDKAMDTGYTWIEYTALGNPAIDERHLEKAAYSKSKWVRERAAANPLASEEVKIIVYLHEQ